MKNCLQLLVTGAMFAAGAMTASADRYYQRGDEPVYVDDIQAGVQYVLNCAKPDNAGEKVFLMGTTFSFGTENLTKSCIYTFEAAGQNSKGEACYYLKNSDGEYFTMPGREVGYTTHKDYAWKVTVKAVNAEFESDYEYSTEDEDLTGMAAYRAEYRDMEEPLDLSNASFFGDSEYGVVIASAEPDDANDICSTYTYLLGLNNGATSGNVTRGTNYNTNVWVIYTVEQQSATAYLEAVLAELFPDGWDADNVNVGIDPGCYKAEAVDAVTEAYENAMYNATEENAEQLADELRKAYEAYKNSFVNFGPGFYIFTTYRTGYGAMFDNTGNVAGAKANMYTTTDPAIAITHTTTGGAEYSIGGGRGKGFDTYTPEDEDPDNEWIQTAVAPYIIWEVIESDEPGLFYVQNRETKNYIGGAPKDANGNLKPSNAPILVTKDREAKYNMAPSAQYAGYWKFYSPDLTKKSAWGGGWEMGGLHAPGDVLNMVTWNSETDGSLWYPRAVTEDMLKAIDDYKEIPMRNLKLTNLKEEAEQFVEGTKVYNIFDLATGKPAEDLNVFESLDVDGLVTDASQLDSNSIHEGDGDGLEGLVDGDYATFYHSGWSDDYAPKSVVEVEDPETGEITEQEVYDKHYLQMDLGHACSAITVKWFTRGNGNVQGRLYKTTVYASKDGENFEPVTTGEFHYTPFDAAHKVTVAGEAKNGWVGVCSYDLGAAYQYVRVEHSETVHGQARPWMNGAELRVYEGLQYEYKYDKENSPYEAVSEATKAEIEKQLAAAEEELKDELATEETIAALQAALDQFKAETPQPSTVLDLVATAQGIHDAAEAGDEPGYFTQDAIDALQAAIDAANGAYSGTMSVTEVANVKAALQAAIDAFQDALIKPENGIYVIKSKTSNETHYDGRLYTQHSSTADNVNHGWTGNTAEYAESVLGSYWNVEKVEGGYTFKNLYSGLYLAPVGPESEAVSQSEAPYVFVLQFAQEPGCFNFVLDKKDAKNETYVYLNAQPGTGNVVTWSSAKGRDNSAWAFEAVDADELDNVIDEGFIYNLEIAAKPQVATFPVDLDPSLAEEVKFYTIIGQDANNDIQLAEAETVVAGQAYVIVPSAEGKQVRLYTDATKAEELAPVHELQAPVNGLVPVFNSVIVPADCGVFMPDHSKVVYSEAKEADRVKANTGYFNEMPATTEKGDAFIPSAGTFADGIQNIILNSDVQKGIFSLSGVRVNSMKNLPAGLYIINGKKYIVK